MLRTNRPHRPQRRRSGACALAGQDGEACVNAVATPASPRNPFGASAAGALALVAVSPARGTPADAGAIIAGLFGLSDAESEIVAALWAGEAPQAIAERRNVRPTTLKTQLDAIYRKTDVTNQRQLMRLLIGGQAFQVQGDDFGGGAGVILAVGYHDDMLVFQTGGVQFQLGLRHRIADGG